MQYQIQTLPIWDAYKASDGCPLCRIYADREKRLVNEYLTENVMDPHFRSASNEIGFCAEHIRQLYGGQNKLGLALQLETRAATLYKLFDNIPADKKSAKKTARAISEHCGCVICSALHEPMGRYAMTVAEMYLNEPEFPALFAAARHCINHAAALYDVATFAGKSIQSYLQALTSGLRRDLSATETELRAFADCFDFRNAGARPDAQAIPRAVKLLITDKL